MAALKKRRNNPLKALAEEETKALNFLPEEEEISEIETELRAFFQELITQVSSHRPSWTTPAGKTSATSHR